MSLIKKTFVPVFFALFTLYQLNSFLKPFWPTSHDGLYHIIRIREYYYELIHGQFPVRWTDRLDNAYGLPLFNYIYPGPYMLSSVFLAVGLNEVDAYKTVFLLSYFLGIYGYYFLFRKKIKSWLLSPAYYMA